MSAFYSIDSTRVSHREYWWGTRSPAVLIGWLLKWLHVRIPSSTDDPNAESTTPFLVEALPADVAQRFAPIANELTALGFLDPVHHIFQDTGTSTTIYWVTFRHSSGQHFARIHQRIWHQTKTVDRGTFVLFFTAFEDRTFIVSSSGKPDLDTPSSVPMLRRHGATSSALWSAHVEFVAANRKAGIQPVRSREELLGATERHHILLRDFNLQRGVFRIRSGAEHASAIAVAGRLEEATAGGLRHPEVLAEVERIQTKRPGWGNAILILVVSVFAFLAAGSAQQDWKFYLWLIPLLFLHEGGHWLAMKIFGYRNLRMFFIPLFGAAVTGQHWNVPGWKKAIVSLAGPVPGILLGVALTLAGLITHHEWLNHAAFLLLIINGFNLLPVLPLDGGHVMHAILFCRNRWLDISFRILAIVGLLLLSLNGTGRFLMYLAIVMAVGLPVAFKIGKVADVLRRMPIPPPLEGQDRIPLSTADAIVTALKAELPGKPNNRTLALHTVNVFETLNARPPGLLGTLGFLTVHGGSVILVVLCGFLLILNKHSGGLGNFARTALRQPQHSVACNSIERWAAAEAATVISRNTLAATMPDHAAAKRQFNALAGRLPASASLTLIGDSLLLTLPAADDAARERWFAELQASTTNVFVALTNQSITVSLMFVAPTLQDATNLVEELTEYFAVSRFGNLVAPWSPRAAEGKYEAARQTRRMWHVISTNTAAMWNSAEVNSFNRQIVAARKRGAVSEAERLLKEQIEARKKKETAMYDRLRTQGIDSDLVDLHAKLNALAYTNQTERATLEKQISGKLGEDASAPEKIVPRHGTISGFARHQGLLVELGWMSFRDAPTGLPSLLDWLCRKRCRTIKYDIVSTGIFTDDLSE
jgi:Zn-dependent protease